MKLSLTRVAAALAVAAVAWFGVAYVKSKQAAKNAGYFYRLNVKVSHNDEMFDMNIVVACNPELVGKFGNGAMLHFPRFYAERTRENHAVGVRPTLGCAGQTTENGGAPSDLLPSIYWFPDADDMTFAIMYATEDAYANPLSQLKFHGATMHRSSIDEFRAFQAAAKTKSIVPTDISGVLPNRDAKLGPWTIEEIDARGGKAPKPNWALNSCSAAKQIELEDTARAILRKYWPAHKPRYWALDYDQWQEFMRLAGHEDDGHWRRAIVKSGKVLDGGSPAEYGWRYAIPSADGLPTRAGGGVLLGLGKDGKGKPHTPMRVPVIFPVQFSGSFRFYNPTDKNTTSIWQKIVARGGDAKGFAYCLSLIHGPIMQRNSRTITRWEALSHFLPAYKTTPVKWYFDDEAVDTSAMLKPALFVIADQPPYYIFEEDRLMYLIEQYFKPSAGLLSLVNSRMQSEIYTT